jgi:hypothetical protein
MFHSILFAEGFRCPPFFLKKKEKERVKIYMKIAANEMNNPVNK